MLNLQKLIADHPQLFELVHGQSILELTQVTQPEMANEHSISFFSQNNHTQLLGSTLSPLWIVTQTFWDQHSSLIIAKAEQRNAAVLTCKNLQTAMAQVLSYFDRRTELFAFPRGISPSAWIDPTAQIGSNVTVAPFVTIGPNVRIGENSIIGPHCTIEGEVQIGSNCFLEGNVFIGRQCLVGNDCRIKPFASIGTDGFGYAPTSHGTLKIPQIGNVVLEDHVDVGSGSCIDRATLHRTRIGRGTKIDNLVHIAHNCEIGQYCFITACFAVAGSTKIGDFFMTGGATSVADHVTISEKVTLAGASVVTSNIDKPGAYGGNPVLPMNEFLRNRSISMQLPAMRKQIHQILKHLGLNE